MNLKKRKNTFIVSTLIIVSILIVLAPFVLNYKRILQIGFYSDQTKNTISFPTGKGIINSKINLDYDDYERYFFFFEVSSNTRGSVDFIGFLSIEGEILINNNHYRTINSSWSESISTIVIESTIFLYKNQTLSLYLNISAQYFEQNQFHNETVNVFLSSLIRYDESEIGNIEIIFIWIYVLYFSSYFVLPYLVFLITRPVFGIEDQDIDEKRREKYFQALSKKSNSEAE